MRIWWRQTTWVVLVPITTHIPSFINVAHTELWIFFFFVISQSEQICKWGIKCAHSLTTDHMGSTCAHHYPHTKFHQCSPYRTPDIWLFLLLANQNKYANEVLNMCIRWRQTAWVVLVPPTTHIPSLTKISHCVLIRERRFTFWCWRDLNISTYIHTSVHPYRQRYKWKLRGPSSIAGSPQKYTTYQIGWNQYSCKDDCEVSISNFIFYTKWTCHLYLHKVCMLPRHSLTWNWAEI